ncbi:MAG: hypothetical protein ACHRHE_09060 [Tepidisphaerales bacterium]
MGWHEARVVLTVGLLIALAQSPAAAAGQRTYTIQEPFGLAWGPDRVTYRVEFAQGEARTEALTLTDGQGRVVPFQLAELDYWPDKTVKSAGVSFMVSLKPGERATWTLSNAPGKTPAPASDLQVREEGEVIELANARTAIRLPAGRKAFAGTMPTEKVPAPIQAVRLPGGKWIGKGWWQTDVKCTGYSAEVTERGPVFARARLRYDFEGGRFYAATVELSAGQDMAIVSEEYNLSEGKTYPMSGVNGMKQEARYAYVRPTFDSPDKALIWDWWGQTHAVLPTPNAYCFSFGEGLRPDSAEFHGRSQYGNLREGDGGLTYDEDGRFAYVNAFPQWGDEETLYLGLYNSKDPGPMLGIVGLHPSQWQHPDIAPHPDAIIKQYTQTTCLTFERRTSGEAFFRAPADLGKRVYGIGGMERTLARHVIPDRNGPWLTPQPRWGSDLAQRHVRLGRLTLDTVKDWVLDYAETARYPRLFVPEGDRVRYESRRTRKPMDQVKRALDARPGPTDADRKVVAEALARTSGLVRHFAQIDKGLMDFGIEEGVLSDLAEDALASPACTPEQAKELRKWLAAIAYYAVDGDFVPPRQAGFGWGSANMEAQVQCRACRIAALLPNHPQGKAWRDALAKVVTLYIEDQVNESGVTLECPHYGGMAVTMPVIGLAALTSCGDVDLSRAEKRLRAAAHMRLATLLPPDIRGGFRSEIPEGDGYYVGEGVFAPLAGFFDKRDAELARTLAWGVKESANDLGGHSDSAFKLFDVGLDSVQPTLGSEHFPGYGFVMRSGFPRNDEAYVQVYAGSFCWGHGHSDRGTWVMYAKGAPLMMDFAAMYTPSMRENWLHPGGLTFNHDETVRPAGADPKDDWWRKGPNEQYRKLANAPFTAVEVSPSPASADDLNRQGEVAAFKCTPQADFAVMRRRISYLHQVPYLLKPTHGVDLFDDGVNKEVYLKNPFIWTRRFVFVKDADPLGHNYLVIRDDLPGNGELDPCLNLWCLADRVDVQGQVAIYTGQHGVDVYCYVAEPASFTPGTRTVGHPCGFGFAGYYKKTFGKDFREDQIQLQIPQAKRDGGYFVAMVPVKHGEPAPQFQTLADGRAVRVVFPDRTDTIILQPAPGAVELDGRKISSPSALLVKRSEKQELTDLTAK